jgi:hypothetical protein
MARRIIRPMATAAKTRLLGELSDGSRVRGKMNAINTLAPTHRVAGADQKRKVGIH